MPLGTSNNQAAFRVLRINQGNRAVTVQRKLCPKREETMLVSERIRWLRERVKEQRSWIAGCGGDLKGHASGQCR